MSGPNPYESPRAESSPDAGGKFRDDSPTTFERVGWSIACLVLAVVVAVGLPFAVALSGWWRYPSAGGQDFSGLIVFIYFAVVATVAGIAGAVAGALIPHVKVFAIVLLALYVAEAGIVLFDAAANYNKFFGLYAWCAAIKAGPLLIFGWVWLNASQGK